MSVNPLLRSNPVRMMGMASGMDTDSIIQATLRMHQFKIDRQLKNRTLIEWKQQAHNDIKDQIKSLKDTYLSNLGSKTMMNRNTFNTNLATAMAGGKASTAVTVSASVNSSLGSLRITQVKSLAKGTSVTSNGYVSATGNGFDPAAKLGDLNFKNGGIDFGAEKAALTAVSGNSVVVNKSDIEGSSVNWGSGMSNVSFQNGDSIYQINITKTDTGYSIETSYVADITDPESSPVLGSFTLGTAGGTITLGDGTEFTINPDSGNDSKYTYSAQSSGGEEIVTDANGNFRYNGTLTVGGETVQLMKDANGNIGDGKGNAINYYGEATLEINGTAVTLNSNMTITEMVNKVTKEVDNVTMTYDRMSDRFVLTHGTIGSSGTITVGGSDSILQNLFGGSAAAINSADPTNSFVTKGTLAEVVFSDGTSATSSTNNITYRGITIRVNHETGVLTGEDIIDVTVKRDTDKAVDAIKEFLDSYNTIIKKLEDLLSERKTSKEAGYQPLTDEEKAAMTEKQIEDWEAIAKKGILRNDKSIQDLVGKLRSEFFKEIEGTGYTASQLGLTTGNYFGGTGGQIILDEEGEKKLRAALEADPDRVADVFVKIGTGANGMPEGKGLMHKLEKHFNDFIKMSGSQSYTLDALEKSYNEINERIAKLEERMWAEEDKLYRQFAAMETAMSKLQSQGDWFNAMLGG